MFNKQNENETIKWVYLKLADIWLGGSLVIIQQILVATHLRWRYEVAQATHL